MDLIHVVRLERILLQALEQQETPEHPPPLPAGRFARPGSVFAQGKPFNLQAYKGGQP